MQLQLLHQADCGGFVARGDLVGTLGGVDGRIGADGAEGVAQFGIRLALDQMFALLGFDGGVVEVGVDVFQRAEFLHKAQSRLFADAPHARDVVGRVSHQALYLDELFGLDAVFFLNGVHVHGDGLAPPHDGGGQQDGRALADQLQAVAVSGGKEAVIPAGIAGRRQCAQNVVGLPALGRHLTIAQIGEQLFQHRHLLRQLFGHSVPGGLVAVVHLVPERWRTQIECHGDLVGLGVLEQGEQNIQKAKNGVGVAAVLGGQQLDAKKCAVGDAVAVDDQ